MLAFSSLIGIAEGLIAIVETVQNSYDPPDIPNATWLIIVSILSGIFLGVGAMGDPGK